MSVIYEGIILKGREQKKLPYQVRKLTTNYLPDILYLQDQVIEELDNKERLQPLSKAEYEYILEGNGFMIGAFVDNEIIAFRALQVPPLEDNEHLGLDIGLDRSELSKVIYQEISNVHPDYRGNRLQKLLGKLIMEELSNHPYRYVCCTVAPFNIPSLKDKFAQGMQIAALKEKYGDLLRYVFVKDLHKEASMDNEQIVRIKMDDIQKQQEKLDAGWRGVQMEITNDDIWIHYGFDRHRNVSSV